MKWAIKLHAEATKVVEGVMHKIMAIQKWRERGKRRSSRDCMDRKFKYPMHGHVASIRGFKEARTRGSGCAYQKYLGGYTGKGAPKAGDAPGYNWVAYELFGIPDGRGTIVLDEGGIGMECLAFTGQEV